jgi:hypothetical protein
MAKTHQDEHELTTLGQQQRILGLISHTDSYPEIPRDSLFFVRKKKNDIFFQQPLTTLVPDIILSVYRQQLQHGNETVK